MPLIRTKLAVMLSELHSVAGADAPPLTEMGEMARSMERSAGAQAAAVQAAAAARERSSMAKVQARAKDRESERDDRKEEREAAREERKEARAADTSRSEQVLGAVTAAIQMLPSLVHSQQQPRPAAEATPAAAAEATPAAGAAPAPAPAVGPSRFSSMAAVLDSITKFTPSLRSELLEKLEQEMLDVSDILETYKLGGLEAAHEALKAVSDVTGVRIKIISALVAPP
jgi:hypothetical protein